MYNAGCLGGLSAEILTKIHSLVYPEW